jgi:hypothetical protein
MNSGNGNAEILSSAGLGVGGSAGGQAGTGTSGQIGVFGAGNIISGSADLTSSAGFLQLTSSAGMDITDTSALTGITISISGAGTGQILLKADTNSAGISLENDGTSGSAGISINNTTGGGGLAIIDATVTGLTIQSTGVGGIFIQSTAGAAGITADVSGGTGPILLHTNTTGGLQIQHGAGAATKGANFGSGVANTFTVIDGIVTAISNVSDERLKTNIQPFVRGLAAVLAISPKTYQWNEAGRKITDFSADVVQAGFIAQDVQKAIPEAIGQEGEYLSLDTRPILAALVNAVQELTTRLAALESK